jgi:hypothetical protein
MFVSSALDVGVVFEVGAMVAAAVNNIHQYGIFYYYAAHSRARGRKGGGAPPGLPLE